MILYFIIYYGAYIGLLFICNNKWITLIGFNLMFYIGNLMFLWRLHKREAQLKRIENYGEMISYIRKTRETPLQTEMIGYNLYNISIVIMGVLHRAFYMREKVDLYIWLGLYIFFTGWIYYYLIRYRRLINHRFVQSQV